MVSKSPKPNENQLQTNQIVVSKEEELRENIAVIQ
jgi:hypothetical protein